MSLFKLGEITLHSGSRSDWKIDCDALTPEDWQTLATLIARKVGPFRNVYGVPNGGTPLADALRPLITAQWRDPYLIVVDVYSTGISMYEAYNDLFRPVNCVGMVVFARKPVKDGWIKALFTMLED